MNHRKTAFVTGASGGIGGACAVQLARQGYDVGVHYHGHRAGAEAVAAQIESLGARAWLVPFDITDHAQIERTMRAFIKERNGLEALVSAAGVVYNQMSGLTGVDNLDYQWAVNLRGAYLAAKIAAKAMLRAHWGRIVFIGSLVGQHGNAGQSAYAMVKAGLVGLAKSLARELAARRITVNVVAPGYIDTAMTRDLTEEIRQFILQQIPLHRAGSPEEVGALVGFLCGETADYITGAVFNIDGGMGA